MGVLTALTAVHLADLAHGSLTPHNVIVADDGVKLTDVAVGPPAGEPAYRAPEQIRGERYDAYADMFAWAATVVFAATGRPPFPQEPQAVLNAQPDLGGLEERLRQVALPALAKEPGQRPTAYAAMLQLLGGGAAGAQPAAGPGTAMVLPAQPPQQPVGEPRSTGSAADVGPAARAPAAAAVVHHRLAAARHAAGADPAADVGAADHPGSGRDGQAQAVPRRPRGGGRRRGPALRSGSVGRRPLRRGPAVAGRGGARRRRARDRRARDRGGR
ncbi:hypothetical protein GCM10027612_22610 [Microbispora bryophytorum subsp. camponoti]